MVSTENCQPCKDDFFFQQVCDEVEGEYKDKTVHLSSGKTYVHRSKRLSSNAAPIAEHAMV